MTRTALLASCLLAVSAQAALVSQDSEYGVDTITLDTETGLEWLDWDLTLGLSFDEVSAELGTGGGYDGFRFATGDEVAVLWANAGIVDIATEGPIGGEDFTAANYAPAIALVVLLGDTGLGGNLTEGLTADAGSAPGSQVVAELQLCTPAQPVPCRLLGAEFASALASLGPNDQPADQGSGIIGSALVRDAAVVPLPGASWLAISGFVAVAARARRTRPSL